ncbi:unnamed protein product [Hydatigera taeniaeformis]|uniref:BEACH domain-containing protein n=1 Tax=Hydatigena taeniaeformis TaxID=6205 RepID=A0A0R3WRY3_HYDTA|nr:unnamed protein product [Hydatigera taeniaeformis]
MTEENVNNIRWDLDVRNLDASLRNSKWQDKMIECTFSDALSILREIELNTDKDFLTSKYACEIITHGTTAPEYSYVKVKDLVQKAISTYSDLLDDSLVATEDSKLTARIKGHSLFSLIRYNPSRLKDENLLQFVFYQLICLLECFHRRGIPYLNLEPISIFVDDLFRVSLAPPCVCKLGEFACFETNQSNPLKETLPIQNSVEFHEVLSGWITGKVSNYDYLMYINHLAGRRAGDPTASAVLPWVTDFSSPQDGAQHLRDLTRTKFRLTKGERQLDATYLHLEHSDSSSLAGESGKVEPFLPHHILDMMPNLAYYTYKVQCCWRHVSPDI